MPNRSFLSHLRGHHAAECLLDWTRRMNIAIGSAEGTAFPASGCGFWICEVHPRQCNTCDYVKGTVGYLAPEYAMLGKASESCDVYSFGVLLLELVSGKRPLEKVSATSKSPIAEWALPLVSERKLSEVADPRLKGKYVEEELKRVVLIALVCTDNRPEKRPIMLEVVELLKRESKQKLSELENNDLFKYPRFTV
ncbi:Brassinosteroid insensitive 1-associated receptor kinase 1 isoform 2 [Hibiscus syriacus]|uniref:Brassinosteroid insensitive 1-associated receptor kinase 1 isoform 2 n=1 Tax=Hibiscus syriacus TaxID=106335 RepID=A0A6A3A514_HIBSY|nr:Brassinosteroid insensitive 1-associated receptor kinase 1 isoform 2 [Hibiscus syriacus]